MQFIDGHGILLFIELLTLLHPEGVSPFKPGDIIHTGGRARTVLRIVGIRVCLKEKLALVCGDTEFVQISFPHFWYEELVNAHVVVTFHHVFVGIPFVEIPHNRHGFCMRSPDGEIHAVLTPLCCRMCTHQLIDFIMCPFPE